MVQQTLMRLSGIQKFDERRWRKKAEGEDPARGSSRTKQGLKIVMTMHNAKNQHIVILDAVND